MKCLATACCALFFFSACQTARDEIPSPVGGKSYSGQMQYVGRTRSFVGDFIVVVSSNAFQLAISKGLPLISIQEGNGIARLESSGRSWQGSVKRTPAAAKTWVVLHEVFTELAAGKRSVSHVDFQSQTPGLWNAEAEIVGSRPKSLRVNFPHTSERLVFAISGAAPR
jgi:hypothetical protein